MDFNFEMNICEKTVLPFSEKNSKNAFLSVLPPNLEFTYSAGNFKAQEKTLEITNYFSKSCPIQLLPFDTQYFRIRDAIQRQWLTPGSVCKMHIIFVPDETREYNDVLKIRYFNDRILQIKIAAKISCNIFFPANVNFGNVPLGQAACYKIPIYSHAKEKVSFAILPSKEDPCIDIYPRCGHIKPNQEPIIVMILYRPLQYVSMNFQIRIFLSDLCKIPYVINFHAYTRPRLLREALENVELKTKSKTQLTKVSTISGQKIKSISPVKPVSKSFTKTSIPTDMHFEKMSTKQCYHLPGYTLHAVNCILNSKTRKPFGEHELKGPLNVYIYQIMEQKALQLKNFLTKVENYRQQNEQTKMHHRPKANYRISDVSENEKIEIVRQREQHWDDYKNSMHTNVETVLFERREVRKIKQRILRASQKYPNVVSVSFRGGQSCLRYCKIKPFLQAARKIVLRNRLLKILGELRQLTTELIVEFEEPLKET